MIKSHVTGCINLEQKCNVSEAFHYFPSSGSNDIVRAEELFRTLNLSSKLTQLVILEAVNSVEFVAGPLYGVKVLSM